MKSLFLSAALSFCCLAPVIAEDWGTVTGRIVVTGTIPEPVVLHKKGADIKDKEVCAAEDVMSEELLIDKETKGLANVFVYLVKAPKSIHPDLKKPEKATMIFDQKGCMFIPHCMVVLGGQSVEVISHDNIAHNTHTYPIKGTAKNVLIAPNTPEGKGEPFDCKVGESLPFKVACDFHSWMNAYWLVVDHPYAAVTDKEGNFTIPNLPVGEHEFRVWHERVGYVERKYKIVVKKGDNAQKPLEVAADKLKGEVKK